MTTEHLTKFSGKIEGVSTHACEKATERFNVKPSQAEEWIRRNVKQSIYVNILYGDKGSAEPSRLYVHKGIGFVLASESNVVKTVMEPHSYYSIQDRVYGIVRSKLRQATEHERKVTRRNNVMKAELNVERAEIDLRLLRARSSGRINALGARRTAITERIAELDDEIREVRHQSTLVARGVAQYV